ncbi:hypothetical protein PMAYCL1PPCAC_19053 [Pristionchus mayeri]|uniref:Uncharacterized protein n=1 Tax=Pristionchus mayeri TaxID=1317129 RepID=A0AAN5CQL3_9BILA|nr:hypothetical protein PMAYCL1PPCAC_19053 [Pristionchus mayeri]
MSTYPNRRSTIPFQATNEATVAPPSTSTVAAGRPIVPSFPSSQLPLTPAAPPALPLLPTIKKENETTLPHPSSQSTLHSNLTAPASVGATSSHRYVRVVRPALGNRPVVARAGSAYMRKKPAAAVPDEIENNPPLSTAALSPKVEH